MIVVLQDTQLHFAMDIKMDIMKGGMTRQKTIDEDQLSIN
jgi:hypothetical protein